MKEKTSDFYCCYNKLLFFLTIRLWLVSHCLNIYGQRQRLQLELGYRFSFFFLSSFKWILAYQLYALKELQKLDNKHLYLNTVQWKDHTDIFLEVQYELQLTQNKTGHAFSLVGCAINRFINCFTRWFCSKFQRQIGDKNYKLMRLLTAARSLKMTNFCLPEKVTPEL